MFPLFATSSFKITTLAPVGQKAAALLVPFLKTTYSPYQGGV
jgi:hypothetical protein